MNTIEKIILERQDRLTKQMQTFKENEQHILPILDKLESLAIRVDFLVSVDLHFAGKADLLTKVFKELRGSGWNTNSDRPQEKFEMWSGLFRKEDCSISIWVMFSSSVCHRVKVGTTLVEQDVFEIQCSE